MPRSRQFHLEDKDRARENQGLHNLMLFGRSCMDCRIRTTDPHYHPSVRGMGSREVENLEG